ncbi:unnamed protein product [Lactuca virosa]|uniref:Uncharacterized protein n=1 Tax=Lactuca virosa TaxID=75947 RepID=A0AAU9NVV6_9ASTR|nr:unnamed protein product [Lactuca virosa]
MRLFTKSFNELTDCRSRSHIECYLAGTIPRDFTIPDQPPAQVSYIESLPAWKPTATTAMTIPNSTSITDFELKPDQQNSNHHQLIHFEQHPNDNIVDNQMVRWVSKSGGWGGVGGEKRFRHICLWFASIAVDTFFYNPCSVFDVRIASDLGRSFGFCIPTRIQGEEEEHNYISNKHPLQKALCPSLKITSNATSFISHYTDADESTSSHTDAGESSSATLMPALHLRPQGSIFDFSGIYA